VTAGRAGPVLAVASAVLLAGCSSGGAKTIGEQFLPPATSTTTLSQAFDGSYDIAIDQVVTGPGACRTSGTFHEQVAVADSGGARRVTLTNTVPSADGKSEIETGAMQPDGAFEATGAFGPGTYTWRGTFPGDSTVSGTFMAVTPAATCTWRVSGRRR
jgi:hypothetical protein